MFERIGTSYFFKDKFLYRSVWRNVKLQEVKNSRGQKYQHHKPNPLNKWRLFYLIQWGGVAKICVVNKNYMLLQFHKKKQQNCDKASVVHVKHTYIVTAKENCCVSALRKTRRNVEKHWRELHLAQTKTNLNIVPRNCSVKYGWIMVECPENKSDEKTLMKMKKIRRDANEGAKNDTKN